MFTAVTRFSFVKIFLFVAFLQITSMAQEGNKNVLNPANSEVWVLAGQSNMDGNGRTPDTVTNPQIIMYGPDNQWMVAQNPLHRIYEAIAPAYGMIIRGFPWNAQKDAKTLDQELAVKKEESKRHPIGGVGPGLYFAKHILAQTNRPVALIPCGIGGTSMDQWSPVRKPGGDSSLYGAMVNRVKSANVKPRGLLWFQGESEAMAANTTTYESDLLRLIDSFRHDVNDPDLPVIIVQIGRFLIKNPAMDKGYEEIRDIQRRIVRMRKNVYMVASVDLPLDDWAHIATEGQKRLGKRMAEIALTYIYNVKDHGKQIDLESIKLCKDDVSGSNYLHLHFSGVSGKLNCCGLPAQFELRVNGEPQYEFVVSKAELDSNDAAGVNLFLSAVPNSPAQLVFGNGTKPYMNITDSLDIALPAFGPMDIPLKP